VGCPVFVVHIQLTVTVASAGALPLPTLVGCADGYLTPEPLAVFVCNCVHRFPPMRDTIILAVSVLPAGNTPVFQPSVLIEIACNL
jgi:hypothetical protein